MRGTAETPDLILSGEIGVNKTVNTESLNIYENGNYTPPAGVDGYDDIHVDVRPVIDSITIRENGTYEASGEVDGYSPVVVNVPQSAAKVYAKNINANGNYYPDAGYDGFSQISVNVPATPLRPLNVTENGEYNPPTGEGYSKVVVDVPTDPEIESITITENGTYTAPTGVDGYSPVIVNVPQPEDAYYIKDMTPGAIARFDDGADMVLPSLVASIVPVQDLHGYDSPWAGGAGKNKIEMVVDKIKSSNTSGTWDGNRYIINGITFTILTDSANNVIGIKVNGTATAEIVFSLDNYSEQPSGTYTYSGYIENDQNIRLRFRDSNGFFALNEQYITVTRTTEEYRISKNIVVPSGAVASNLVFTPMVCLSNDSNPTTFAPYSNICPISGWTEEVITVTDDLQNPTVTHTTTIPFTDGQGQSVEVFGGSVDVVNGGEQPNTMNKVDLGTLAWTKANLSGGVIFYSTAIGTDVNVDVIPICTQYKGEAKASSNNDAFNKGDGTCCFLSSGDKRIYIRDDSKADLDASAFQTAMNGVEVCYTLATPTTFYTQPTSIKSNDGDNNVSASTGEILSGTYFSETPA